MSDALLLAWNTLLPGYYFYFVFRMRCCNPNLTLPSNWNVAMIVTKAPSEPWSIVKKPVLLHKHCHDAKTAEDDSVAGSIDSYPNH